MKTLFVIAFLALSAHLAHAAVPPCPVPDGPGNEGNPSVDMSCFDFTSWAEHLTDVEKAFSAAGGQVNQVAVPGSYGTLTSRTDIIDAINALIRDKDFQTKTAQIKAKWASLIAMNNPAYLARLGATNNAANLKLMAKAWLPINQKLADDAKKERDDALTAWNANKTEANARTYWDAQRMFVAYTELVNATNDAIGP